MSIMKKTVKKHERKQSVIFVSLDTLQLFAKNNTKKMIVLDFGIFFINFKESRQFTNEKTTNFLQQTPLKKLWKTFIY